MNKIDYDIEVIKEDGELLFAAIRDTLRHIGDSGMVDIFRSNGQKYLVSQGKVYYFKTSEDGNRAFLMVHEELTKLRSSDKYSKHTANYLIDDYYFKDFRNDTVAILKQLANN